MSATMLCRIHIHIVSCGQPVLCCSGICDWPVAECVELLAEFVYGHCMYILLQYIQLFILVLATYNLPSVEVGNLATSRMDTLDASLKGVPHVPHLKGLAGP